MKESNITKGFFENILLFAKGFVMGIAEIVPGVSGSTLALIVGIYKEFITLLYQVSNVVKEFLKVIFFKSDFKKLISVVKKIDFRFAVLLFLGMIFAIGLFSNIVTYLFQEHREYVIAFFFGLVLASITIPWSEIKERSYREVLIVIFTGIVFILILSLTPRVLSEAPHPLYFFIGGALGICAMVLPGVSGSFIFLMLGLYEFIVESISNVTRLNASSGEIFNLVSLALGIFFGFVIFVRFLKYGLKHYSNQIFAFLTGIMIASLRVLWPFEDFDNLLYILLTIFSGFILVFILRRLNL